MSAILQYGLYLAILVILAIPLGAYIKKVMDGEKTFLSRILTPCENAVYKVMRIKKEEEMSWKKYAVSVLIFSGIGLIFLFLLQLLQGVLPGNPQNLPGVKWDLSFNTAVSFVTNTNWQAYSGESTLSYLSQALGLTVQNFVSAATGIAVLFAMIRGFIKVKSTGLGSFWVDMTRIIIHILLPLNLIIALCLVGGGVIQNLKPAETVSLVEPIAVSAEGEVIENAVIDQEKNTVTVDGKIIPDAEIVTDQFVPMGPAASQIAIKQSGTNGGGFMGVNSAHPLALLDGLEQLPTLTVSHKGISLHEFDLDGAIKRAPQLILVDELAHTNAEGCRHSKRYQDVEELLRAGIDVYTTVNVQHIESLNDMVASITGVTVRERVPDHLFDDADQVELVDIEPEELIDRLHAGQIYQEAQANRALEHFFSIENLTALREIALRRCADRINKMSEKVKSARGSGYFTDEHILICLSSSPTNAKIIRTAARMADAFKGSLTALFVETPEFASMSEANKQQLRSNIHLAQQMGAAIETVYGDDIAFQIAEFARLSGVSKAGATTENYILPNEQAVAAWVHKNNKRAGATTDTLGSAKCLYLAVRVSDMVYGVVGIGLAGEAHLDSFENSIVLSILGECALALENERAIREREESAVLAKNEQLRANLLRSISHDLRTPLTSISGNAGVLLANGEALGTKKCKQLYTAIYDDSLWLINLVENLLSVTRIEDGTMQLKLTAELVDEAVAEAVRHISRQSAEHHIIIRQQEDFLLAKMDARLIVQVIINIVDNAVKYTPKGSTITITTRKEGKWAAVEIADDGPGIPDDAKPRIFDMFYTAGAHSADSRRSLGLGLALCKSIINAHGGEISVADNQPSGTIFRFTLPAEEVTLHA